MVGSGGPGSPRSAHAPWSGSADWQVLYDRVGLGNQQDWGLPSTPPASAAATHGQEPPRPRPERPGDHVEDAAGDPVGVDRRADGLGQPGQERQLAEVDEAAAATARRPAASVEGEARARRRPSTCGAEGRAIGDGARDHDRPHRFPAAVIGPRISRTPAAIGDPLAGDRCDDRSARARRGSLRPRSAPPPPREAAGSRPHRAAGPARRGPTAGARAVRPRRRRSRRPGPRGRGTGSPSRCARGRGPRRTGRARREQHWSDLGRQPSLPMKWIACQPSSGEIGS